MCEGTRQDGSEIPSWHGRMQVHPMSDWNTKIIDEFRANEGRVGGPFEGAPLVLVHHRGRKSGRELRQPDDVPARRDRRRPHVRVRVQGRRPDQPRLVLQPHHAGRPPSSVGTETYDVTVRELTGEERDRLYAEQARRYPGFAEYERRPPASAPSPSSSSPAADAVVVLSGLGEAGPRVEA